MNPENGMLESRLIDPDKVDWARVMVVYRLLALNQSIGEDSAGGEIRGKLEQWLRSNTESGSIEFELAMRIMFDVTMDTRFDDLNRMLFKKEDEYPDFEGTDCNGKMPAIQ